MRKLLLDPEDLRVETFAPAPARAGRGTVRGQSLYSEDPYGCSHAGNHCTDGRVASIYSEDEAACSAVGTHCTDVRDP